MFRSMYDLSKLNQLDINKQAYNSQQDQGNNKSPQDRLRKANLNTHQTVS